MFRKFVAAFVAIMMLLMLAPTSAFAAEPSVQEVEALIAQIGAVTRENCSAVERATDRYGQQVENEENDIGDEESQLTELRGALEKLQFDYVEDEYTGNLLVVTSPYCNQNEETGQSCAVPFMYIFGASIDPVLGVGFMHIDSQYLDMDTVEIDTNESRYTYNSNAFLNIVKNKTVVKSAGMEKLEELAVRLATEDDIDMMMDMVKSGKVNLRFGRYNSAKPDLVECPMPENDKQAIVDVLNAYYLYLNTTQAVRAKALAELT